MLHRTRALLGVHHDSVPPLEHDRRVARVKPTVRGQRFIARSRTRRDAFAGAGVYISRTTGEFVLGSPLNALNVEPPFREFHLIDLDSEKTEALLARL